MPRVFVSKLIPRPLASVWEHIRDFNSLPDWHPGILESRIEDGEASNSVGCVRDFVLEPDARIRERLLALSDVEHYYTYRILEAPVPVENYVATIRLRPLTIEGHTFAEWEANFGCPPAAEEALETLVREVVFEAGLKALAAKID